MYNYWVNRKSCYSLKAYDQLLIQQLKHREQNRNHLNTKNLGDFDFL